MTKLRGPRLPAFATRQIEVAPALQAPRGPNDRPGSDRREIVRTTFDSVLNMGPVAQTSRPWLGVDVYVSLPPIPAGFTGSLSVFVWAVNGGFQSLAATGRVACGPLSTFANALPQSLPVWVAAARGVAESWAVTAEWITDFVGVDPVGSISFVTCASDDACDPPPELGAQSFGVLCGTQGGNFAINTIRPRLLELLYLVGRNRAAAARWLHVHDAPLDFQPVASFAGVAPIFSIPLGAANGGGFAGPLRYRCRGFLQIVGSSVADTTTVANDVAGSATVR